MSLLGVPIDVKKSEINDTLNVTILVVFAMGMYTVIYFSTMYIYITRTPFQRRVVPATITLLFLCNIIGTGARWYVTKWQLVDNGDTRDSVFASLFGPRWAFLEVNIPGVGFVLADGLLIWRCFYAWNRSLRIISIPLLLIIIEIALGLAQVVIHATHTAKEIASTTLSIPLDNLLSSSYFTIFVTSLGTTVLIAYRIHSGSKQEGVSKRRFKHIIDIVVQSGVVYSFSTLVSAIAFVYPGANSITNTRMYALTAYISALTSIIAGISATVMVARVSMLATNATFPSTSIHLSNLQFDQTAATGGVEINGIVSANRNSGGKGKDVEGKVQ
ncbi:hypothetical protein BJ912DRAFT_635640 [Pholiota molesta]|nr:hypothetical protein BJ912DRAFT_635640 [Pholiota molesta]